MANQKLKLFFLVFMSLILSIPVCFAQADTNEQQTNLAMRMIGHQILLNSGDSVSRVMPIEKDENRYKISFEKDFQYDTEGLVAVIDTVVRVTQIANSYIVEVEDCETGEIVYGYKVGNSTQTDIIPCQTRILPTGCYKILFTILEKYIPPVYTQTAKSVPGSEPTQGMSRTNILMIVLIIGVIILLAVFTMVYRKRIRFAKDSTNIILIGKYKFDKRNMELSFDKDKIELTSKEAELLYLLHNFANATVEREIILKNVWGDNGDYVGRTLDVFISKLRKKLEADSSIKIVNIRGVGYKLVLN